jgi:hypothetical protein
MPAAARFMLEVSWGNPTTSAPQGFERVEWAVCGWDRAADEAWLWSQKPDWFEPGCGYAMRWSAILPPPRRLPPETKARIRRRSLRRRLEAKVPLFADQLEEAELARRPGYFQGE